MADDLAGAETEVEKEQKRALIEARMRQAETFAWSVPALVIAGQSFLLTTALTGKRRRTRRRSPRPPAW